MLVFFLFFLPTFRCLWFMTSLIHVPQSYFPTHSTCPHFLFLPPNPWPWQHQEESTQHSTWHLYTFNNLCCLSDLLCLLTTHSWLFLVLTSSKYLCFPVPHDWDQTSRQKDRGRKWKEDTFHPPRDLLLFSRPVTRWQPASLEPWPAGALSATLGWQLTPISSWLRSN